jgi:hypothetical protein
MFLHVFFGGMSSGSSSRERRPDVMSISCAGTYQDQIREYSFHPIKRATMIGPAR